MDVIWGESKQLYWNYFGGVTLQSAPFLNSQQQNIADEATKIWDQVTTLIIDEISFSSENQMKKLNNFLNRVKNLMAMKFHHLA